MEQADLSSIRHAVSAGEPLNAPVIERWKELHGVTIYEGYGQTENTLLVPNYPGLGVRPGSMGKPFPGCDVKVVDMEGNECQPDEPGDIALASAGSGRIPCLMKEYWGNRIKWRPSTGTASTSPAAGRTGMRTGTCGS